MANAPKVVYGHTPYTIDKETAMASKLDPIRSFVQMQVEITLSDLLANGSAGQQMDLFRRGELQAVVTAHFSGPTHKRAILQETLRLTRALAADAAAIVYDVVYTAAPGDCQPSAPIQDPWAQEGIWVELICADYSEWTIIPYGRDDDDSVYLKEPIGAGQRGDGFDGMVSVELSHALARKPQHLMRTELVEALRRLHELDALVQLVPTVWTTT
jgi:hypothetical protein